MYDKKPWLEFYGNVPESNDYPRVTMYDALMKTVAQYPERIAYDFMDYTAAYAQAWGMSFSNRLQTAAYNIARVLTKIMAQGKIDPAVY